MTEAGPFELSADSLKETRYTSVILGDNETGDSVIGHCSSTEGYYRSMDIRESVLKDGEEKYFESVMKACPQEVVFTEKRIDSLKNYDRPVTVEYNLSFSPGGVEHFYFNPMLSKAIRENPFTSAERQYPIDMPYTRDDLYVLHMDIPKGYEVEEMPKALRVKLNDKDGYFEYIHQVDSQTVQLRSRLVLNRANFRPDEYQSLRDFYALVVKKQSELIVFRKKK